MAFSRAKAHFPVAQPVNPEKLLAVLNHPYSCIEGSLEMDLRFPEKTSSKALFILPNQGSDISIRSSSVSLEDVKLDANSLSFRTQGSGEQVILWPDALGEPVVSGTVETAFRWKKEGNRFRIETTTSGEGEVVISTAAPAE
jgi:hypothetical protein